MKKIFSYTLVVLILVFFVPIFAGSTGSGINTTDTRDTRLLEEPAICDHHIAFAYGGDLWAADADGQHARRLTGHEGLEFNPVFSPDGKWIAFNGQYDGNVDVFVVPVQGGVPKRLTWHPGYDFARGFTPDGAAVLFVSTRNVFTNRYTQLFTVPVSGGFPTQLKIPNAYKAVYSPDGKQMAYTPLSEAFRQWKHYRGGTVSRIWIYQFKDHSVEQLPQPEGRCNDTDPMWMGNKIYFRSDRNGEFNLFSFDLGSKEIKQLTHYKDYPILRASAGGGKIIYEQAGYLHIYDPAKSSAKKLSIGVAADLSEVRPRYVKGDKADRFIRNSSISPTGARAVFEFRGEILTVPAKKGDPRNLTNTTGVHERSPAWSPDGKTIAYLSDASGEYQLHIKNQDGKGKVRAFRLKGAGFYSKPVWSPDGKKMTYVDNSKSIYWIDLETGVCKKIGSDFLFELGSFPRMRGVWSPDSQWIVYTLNTASYMRRAFLYSIEQDKSYPITDAMSDVSEPVFDKSGKYLYFLASTDAGPVRSWFDMSNADMRVTRSIYLAVLAKTIPSPLAKESDEEEGNGNSKEKDSKKKTNTPTPIDLDGLSNRVLSLPVPAGNHFNLQAGEEGEVFYLEGPPVQGRQRSPSSLPSKLHKFDLKERKDSVILANINNYSISFNKKKVLFRSGKTWEIAPVSAKMSPGKNALKIADIAVLVSPLSEWKQIFDEAWRINRDYFYDPGMHGADWEAMKKKYALFLPHLSCRRDLNRVIQWMCSELAVGHHSVRGGDTPFNPQRVPGGLLGADYAIENGRYRFKKVYGGLNWNPDLRSPLTEPGVDVKAGEYLLAVNGQEVRLPDNLFRFFENTSGKIVEITVGPNPDGTGSRTVSVVPIANEYTLRNRDWIEGNIKKVDKATNGRAAYVYVPNTTRRGHEYFKRYFFPQAHKQAIIVDERFNGGGQVADYYIDILRRPFIAYWNMRYCTDTKTPAASIQGPKVMLIDETAGSGGDLLPWMFRKFKLGKLIGKRTWGGLVGTMGYPRLMDGGRVAAPNVAIWTEDGWVVENVGVQPDIEVEQWPAQVIKGRDPQLEKAIEVIMEELEKNPPKKLKRPPYPVRVQ